MNPKCPCIKGKEVPCNLVHRLPHVDRQTDIIENFTFLQTMYAGCNNVIMLMHIYITYAYWGLSVPTS